MRDWNKTNNGLQILKIEFWSYLWGIEILLLRCIRHNHLVVLILPMRDWNWFVGKVLKAGKAFWSYLWGIEIKMPAIFSNGCYVFWSYLWGIEIYIQLECSLVRWHGFDLTYEGLKYSFDSKLKRQRYLFWSYLWGIEMKFPAISIWSCYEFWSYLWGIEIRWVQSCEGS